MASLGDFTDDSGGLASNDAEARYDHIGWYDGAIEDADVVFNYSKLADDDFLADVDVASDGSSLDDCAVAYVNVVAQSEREVGEGPAKRKLSEGLQEQGNSLECEST